MADKPTVMKRKGANRPNRGGGRFNKKSGFVPARKGNSGIECDEDFSVSTGIESYEEVVPEGSVRRKVEMQTLHMTEENQQRLLQMLQRLNGKELELQDNQYKNNRGRVHQYWMEDHKLQVQPRQRIEDGSSSVNKFVLKKLLDYGFHKSRCISAIEQVGDDFGVALEHLMSECFHVHIEENNEPTDEILLGLRRDEALVLESIYGDAFSERIPDRVWVITLDLPDLLQAFTTTKDSKNLVPASKKQNQPPVCKFYLQNACQRGLKCKFQHIIERPEVVSHKPKDDHLKPAEKVTETFELQIRFPKGNTYPYIAPVVTVSTTNPEFPKAVCLNITSLLIKEAQGLCGESVYVYELMEVLNAENLVKKLMSMSTNRYSLPKPVAESSPETFEEEEEIELVENYPKENREFHQLSAEEQDNNNVSLKKRFSMKKQGDKEYAKMLKHRKELPAWNERQNILRALNKHQVVVISGATGCGKSTQVPQYILDQWLESNDKHRNIICTQPRRIAAMGVATRVAQERVEKTGNAVGYQIRLESKTSKLTRLLFCTTGIFLRRLESDSNIEDVTHIIVDEVHERSEESDFLLMVLRDILTRRRDLRLLLMSATLNAQLFADYFGDVPIIEIPGKTFEVVQLFLEDAIDHSEYVLEESSQYARPSVRDKVAGSEIDDRNDAYELQRETNTGFVIPKDNLKDERLNPKQIAYRYTGFSKKTQKVLSLIDYEKLNFELIEKLLEYIVVGDHPHPRTGSILVFLPGMAEITTLYDSLQSNRIFCKRAGRFVVLPLHSSLSSEEQAAVFRPAPGGDDVRKLILSTNIAETSVTIDDCVFVVDCGKVKEKRFDPQRNMESLDTVWVSRANAIQRKGRAGRVMPGVCFHLFTETRFRFHLAAQPIPEIQRVPLERILMRLSMMPCFKHQAAADILGRLLEPPEAEAISAAQKRLMDIGALDSTGNTLTSLGHHLAKLPVDVRVGKLLIMGSVLQCLDAALTMAAILSVRSPFQVSFENKEALDRKKQEFMAANSDQLTVLKAYRTWRQACRTSMSSGYRFAKENYLSVKTLQTIVSIKHQLLEDLSEIGFAPANISFRQLERQSKGDAVLDVLGDKYNVYGENNRVCLAVLCAALYPNIVSVVTPSQSFIQTVVGAVPKAHKKEDIKFKTKQDGYVRIHPSSVNKQVTSFDSPYLIYHEKIRTNQVYIRECSMVPAYPLLLFGGSTVTVERRNDAFILSLDDGWILFKAASHKNAEILRELRSQLDLLLAQKIAQPNLDLTTCPRGSALITTIITLITTQ